jgi:hypothetical protein
MTVSQLEYRFNIHIAIVATGFGLAIFGNMFEIKSLTLLTPVLATMGVTSTLKSIRFAVQLAIAGQQK